MKILIALWMPVTCQTIFYIVQISSPVLAAWENPPFMQHLVPLAWQKKIVPCPTFASNKQKKARYNTSLSMYNRYFKNTYLCKNYTKIKALEVFLCELHTTMQFTRSRGAIEQTTVAFGDHMEMEKWQGVTCSKQGLPARTRVLQRGFVL